MAVSIQKRPNGKWRVRVHDPHTGKEVARHFSRRVDAVGWQNEMTAAAVTGQFVHPAAGRVTLFDYAEQWRAIQAHRPSTRVQVEHLLHRHIYPSFGSRELGSIRPSEVQAWIRRLETGGDGRKPLAASTIGTVHTYLRSVMMSAVRDHTIATSPCEGTRPPKKPVRRVVPLTTAQVHAVTEAMPAELQALVTFAAGTGLRPGECLGLTLSRLDMLRREVVVDQQLLTIVGSPLRLGPPKTDASVRTVPLAQVVVDALAAHLAAHPANEDGLVFHLDGKPISRQKIGPIWRPAVASAGLPKRTGMHALLHYFASLLIRYGESVKTVQVRLGHASATETLNTYSHLWPDSDDRTRTAIDEVLARTEADSGRTEGLA